MDITLRTARRYILGRQGLWPGRRWAGPRGTERAMRAMEHLQLDPLATVTRAQDLMLASRVIDYRPDDWMIPTYERRRFFEWGGWLAVRPMDELPYWRVLMRRERDLPGHRALAREHADAIAEMRHELTQRRTIANRDFAMTDRTRVDHYRGRKDSAVALHYLWRIGEAMVHHRDRFERVYARADRVAPARWLHEASDADADEFHLRTMVASAGLTRFSGVRYALVRDVSSAELRDWRSARIEDGTLLEVQVEGWRAPHYAMAEDAGLLRTLAADRVPRAWRGLETTTTEETTFLSPLDPVSARGRAAQLFGFEYKWEVYTPAAQRRYGYYVLPVLWGDRLVARFDARFERATRTLHVLGLWFEDPGLVDDPALAAAFERGMARFAGYLGAERIDTSGLADRSLRSWRTRLAAIPAAAR
jgi:uncharacterized protein YcaQ